MLKITAGQMKTLAEQMEMQFVRRAVLHMRRHHAERCEGKDDAALQRYVQAMIAFARERSIWKQDHVLRLIDLQVTTGYSSRPQGYAAYRLSQPGIDDENRVNNFEAALKATRTPVLISLDTDLAGMEVQRG